MTIAPELLESARTAGATLVAAEHQALLARTGYHTAIRRMHLAGAPLREIAQALGLSHQRVQQIVSSAGGSWWRRAWRSRRVPADAACTWCGRPAAEVEKLIAGPRVYICDRCVAAAGLAADGRQSIQFGLAENETTGSSCAFCGKGDAGDRRLVIAPPGQVCTECLQACRDILDRAEAAGRPVERS
jgi:hypothetical protein